MLWRQELLDAADLVLLSTHIATSAAARKIPSGRYTGRGEEPHDGDLTARVTPAHSCLSFTNWSIKDNFQRFPFKFIPKEANKRSVQICPRCQGSFHCFCLPSTDFWGTVMENPDAGAKMCFRRDTTPLGSSNQLQS